MGIVTNQEVQDFARSFVRGAYRDRTALDQDQALAFMRAVLRRIVGEQITAIECLGGLGGWSRDSLLNLLSDAAELELTQVLGAFSETFTREMLEHAGQKAAPMGTA